MCTPHFTEANAAKMEERRDALIGQIRKAFTNVSRVGGVSLHEADVIDSYGSRQQRDAARKLDTESVWPCVPQ
jgi:hypothetical protein